MTSLVDDARRMVPRWRPSGLTAASGEFTPLHAAARTEPPSTDAILRDLVADWLRNRRYGYAADLVSAGAALGSGQLPSEVGEAAAFVLRSTTTHDRRSVRRLAEKLLAAPDVALVSSKWEIDATALPTTLRDHRRAARRYAFNPLAWVDLARAHASLGHRRAAERAMRVALGLAPEHRFVLRSFTRLALHLGTTKELDTPVEAWERLRRAVRARRDPWLVAAEIATAMVIRQAPKSVKTARELLGSNNFSPFDLSELAGALGSLEIDSGAVKLGRKLLGRALIQPTDNAVAQVAWTARNRDVSLLTPQHLELELTFEARAWENYRAHLWAAAIGEAERWHWDEPFAARPLQLATFVAAVPLGDFARTARLAQQGLNVNPEDQGLRNNLAFALASSGKWKEAGLVLEKLKPDDVRPDVLIAYVATWGLIHFRQGLTEQGRTLYIAAIARAHKERSIEDEALATLYLAREERLAGCEEAAETARNAADLVQKRPLAHLKAVLTQVEHTSPKPLANPPHAPMVEQSSIIEASLRE